METIARILLTLTTLGYSGVTIMADLNKTHASNPLWTPHARFHVVWQVLSYSGIGLIALYLIWAPGALAIERLYLAAALSVAVYAGFFGAVFSRPAYGGGPLRSERLSVIPGADRPEDLDVGRQRHRLRNRVDDPGGRDRRRGCELDRTWHPARKNRPRTCAAFAGSARTICARSATARACSNRATTAPTGTASRSSASSIPGATSTPATAICACAPRT